ncbi:MAG: hypothetical protein HZA58_08680 [Acidimicrobiia bacterium]|nr:hypothetical protein [Acidimicrobiia bacterium]
MLRRLGVIVVWLLATLGTASLTYAAVSQAGGAMGDAPAVPVAAADIAARVSTTVSSTLLTEPSTTASADTTTTSVGAATPTTVAAFSGTTVASGSTNTTSASTTATQGSHTEYRTIPGVGTVGVSVSGDSVTLVSVQPVAPYDFEVEYSGPDQVEVEFWGDNEYKIHAEAEDGVVSWQVEG